MKTFGNILWLITFGLITAIAAAFLGVICCITIIGIPLGLQYFKLAKLSIWPFGVEVSIDFDEHPVLNVIWLIFGGLEIAVGHFVLGALLCITIIGIPFGLQCFKIGKLSIAPFGSDFG